jgi:hypothetical protein
MIALRYTIAAFACVIAAEFASASELDLRVPGGRFADCEFVGLGNTGSLSGTLTLESSSSDPKWAAAIAIILLDDAKFQTSLRFAVVAVTTSPRFEARYEFFTGARRPVAEALDETPPGVALPFTMSWDKSGRVELAAGSAQPRRLVLDFAPTRAFVLISGGRGRLATKGQEQIDCTKDMAIQK